MKLDRFDIQLTNSQNGVYFGGQTISALVNLQISESMKMKGIILKFKGKSECSWSEGSKDYRQYFHAKEKYFVQKINLTEYDKDGEQVLQPGTYTYTADFVLPENLPSSFEGDRGNVRYLVNVKIDRAWRLKNEVNALFTVVCPYDLNKEKDATKPAQKQASKIVCCLCCATGPVKAKFWINRQGYVPGEAVLLYADIENKSNRLIKSSVVRLMMGTTYVAGGCRKRERDKVCQVERGPIEPYGRDEWRGEKLIIPPVPPSELRHCKPIVTYYLLELEVDVDNTPFDLVVPLHIVIGNIPLENAKQESVFSKAPSNVAPVNVITTQPTSSSTVPNVPPPSYGDSVFGNIEFTKGSGEGKHTVKYTPKYTYFAWY